MKKYQLLGSAFNHRIQVVIDDLSRPMLGLNAEFYNTLSEEIDFIYHIGADVSFSLSYNKLKPVNVEGNKRLLKFAISKKVKKLSMRQHLAFLLNQ